VLLDDLAFGFGARRAVLDGLAFGSALAARLGGSLFIVARPLIRFAPPGNSLLFQSEPRAARSAQIQ
jgi:hypothetical protein